MKKNKITTWAIPVILLLILVAISVFTSYKKWEVKYAISVFNKNVYEYLTHIKPIYTKYVVNEGVAEDEFYSDIDENSYYVVEAKKRDDISDIFYISKTFDKTCLIISGMGIYCDSNELKEQIMFTYSKDFIINDDLITYNNSLSKADISNMRISYKYIKNQYIELYYDEYENVLDIGYDDAKFIKRHITYTVNVEDKSFTKK